MAKIYLFSSSIRIEELILRSASHHQVDVRVIDARRYRRVRHECQWAILLGAGGRALHGFDNACAKHAQWHTFKVKECYLKDCLREFRELVAEGRIEVLVDGKPMVSRVGAARVTHKAA